MILEARLNQNQAMALGLVDEVAKYWTEDVMLCRGLGSMTSGKEAYSRLIDQNPTQESVIYERLPDVIEVSQNWPLAFESGKWNARKGCDNGQKIMSGKYSAQWVKRQGMWLIRSEVFVALTCDDEGRTFQAVP